MVTASPLFRIPRRSWKAGLSILLLLGLLISNFGLVVQPASAAPAITIKVNTTADANTNNNFISLREAILLVNGGTGGNGLVTGLGRALSTAEKAQITGGTYGSTGVAANIVFTDLPGTPTIALAGGTGTANESLPPIERSGVVINGLSGGAAPVTIDGSGAGVPADSDIFWLGWTDTVTIVPVSSVTITNIKITGAKRYGIHINPASSSTISNCTVTQSTSYAILIQGRYGAANGNTIHNCTVGGNSSLGIVINRPDSHHTTISNNRIGTDAAGTSAWPNNGAGLSLFKGTHDNTITGNLISGNTLQGIYLSGGSTGDHITVSNNLIINNKIGTAANGTSALPNVQGIVFDDYVINTMVGGTSSGQRNIIAFNTESGIVVTGDSTYDNQFRRNSIFKNGILGIDLLDDKVPTAGVSGGTVGPNKLVLRPTIIKARVFGMRASITGTASPNSTVELFLADPSPSGYGSGKTYCTTVIANSSGAFSFFGTLVCNPSTARLTATSTLVGGSTSEFSHNILPTKLPVIFLPVIKR